MNKAIRLALLIALAALASWSSTPRAAYALPLCEGLDMHSCSTPGKTIPCLWGSGGGNGACYCDPASHSWNCGG